MKMTFILLAACISVPLFGRELSGPYHFQMLQLETAARRAITTSRSTTGTITFDSDGGYTAGGTSGSYLALEHGAYFLTDPVGGNRALRARLGAGGEVLLAVSTESTGVFSLLVALKAPAAKPEVSGKFRAVSLSLVPAVVPLAETKFGTIDLGAAAPAIGDDGCGTVSDPLFGNLSICVSEGGDYIIGKSRNGKGIFLAAQAAATLPGTLSWMAGFTIEQGAITCSLGSGLPDSTGRMRMAQRFNSVSGSRDFRGAERLALDSQGGGFLGGIPVGAGAGGSLVGASGGSLLFAVPAPMYQGTEPFLHPFGVTNTASFSPAGNPVAPAMFVSLFGSGLQGETAEATSVTVNGVAAEVVFASPGQVNVHLPAEISGPSAQFVVTVDGQTSNAVAVPLSTSSPGIFSVDYSGVGAGMVTHADYTLVTPAAPAAPGEIVLLWVTGLGVQQPAPRVLVGGQNAEVLYAREHPSYPGLYQMNARIPAGVPRRDDVPLTLVDPQGQSDTVEIAIR